ncbi:Possible two-component regulator [hydrothermal vent metagenome]|uniref:Possible two-component regulator n=1 Tax=hydrothermal vent metagenome TaxID=652676 RepID=A0A3B1E242_9ZZZZ
MNILIIEDEIYLAQKIILRFQDNGHNVSHITNLSDISYDIYYDTILLSTNITGNYEKVIQKYSSSIIILLVTYISDATVTKPIQNGACDYMIKPFMIDELTRKIEHYEQFNILQKENKMINNYLNFMFHSTPNTSDIPDELPFLIETNNQKIADKIVFKVAKRLNIPIKLISVKELNKVDLNRSKNQLLYIHDFHTLKQNIKTLMIQKFDKLNIILSSTKSENVDFKKVTIMTNNKISTIDSILTVNDYIKQITLNFQTQYPDTELSRRLGISRKSLWEKRKKFGIEKKRCNTK